jgi:hypothetical protein
MLVCGHSYRRNARGRLHRFLATYDSQRSQEFRCTPEFLRAWLGDAETIDHIVPLHQAKTEDELRRLNHFINLRPLSSSDNAVKGAKATEEAHLLCRKLLGRGWSYDNDGLIEVCEPATITYPSPSFLFRARNRK